MKTKLILLIAIAIADGLSAFAQPGAEVYHETPRKVNDLIHTKLDVRLNYKKRYLYGKAWITLKPHIDPVAILSLDAKGMDIRHVWVDKSGVTKPLSYRYDDSLNLMVRLDRTYSPKESYTICIDYVARPDELHVAKGLYFINPDGSDKNKPVQVWTQGETEGASTWFPTIDQPQQKMTEELTLTVPSKYTTLSNGRLVSQKKNADGTRSDYWRMDLPHSPYLVMMAVGDFKIFHDHWRNKPVEYYLEPKYASYAKDIFGSTPEMMEFFSKRLGMDYPWNKYSQIVVRDYVSGAMENTTATLHGEYVQGTHRQMVDRYYDWGMSTVAHELFHQWFGDYVTCESWSNLTVNESFADFGEMLWAEYKYGRDEAEAHSFQALQNYLSNSDNFSKDLVRFNYKNREEMFDAVTYSKGGRILAMLRNYLGDIAFFKGLKTYLVGNAFQSGEAHQLRMALEAVSGQDLNWFFNQWYFGAGHPVLDISYHYENFQETVIVQQMQSGQLFKLPVAIDIYQGGKRQRHQIWLRKKNDTLRFATSGRPDLVNFDADKILVCQKTDRHTNEEFAFLYAHAPRYLDRLEGLNAAIAAKDYHTIIAALNDDYYGLRLLALQSLDPAYPEATPLLTLMAKNEQNTLVRAAAISAIGGLKRPGDLTFYKASLANSSYAIQAASLTAMSYQDTVAAYQLAKGLEHDSEGVLTTAIASVYTLKGKDSEWPFVSAGFQQSTPQEQYNMMNNFAAMIGRLSNKRYVHAGIKIILDFGIRFKSSNVSPKLIPLLKQIARVCAAAGDTESAAMSDDAAGQLKQ